MRRSKAILPSRGSGGPVLRRREPRGSTPRRRLLRAVRAGSGVIRALGTPDEPADATRSSSDVDELAIEPAIGAETGEWAHIFRIKGLS